MNQSQIVVPKLLDVSPWFVKGNVNQKYFTEPLREATRNCNAGQIPLTTNGPYMLFADIGIPCKSPQFSQYYDACNKIYIALNALASALSSANRSEWPALFANAAEAFDNVENFPWKVPERCRFATFSDNREKISAALQAVSLFSDSQNQTQVEKLDEIAALNEQATPDFAFLNNTVIQDTKYTLLSQRACAESERVLASCENAEPSQADVTLFVQHAATAIVLREKVTNPPVELVTKIDELVATLNKYHRKAYEDFLSSLGTNN